MKRNDSNLQLEDAIPCTNSNALTFTTLLNVVLFQFVKRQRCHMCELVIVFV